MQDENNPKLRDRGKLKWQGFFMPEQVALLRRFNDEYYHFEKPEVDEYQLAEFDERINYAMEYHLPVKFTLWEAGRFSELIGRVHYVDPITSQLRVKSAEGFVRINLSDITAVEVVED
ncbi:YolD-like family protein [Robertmurraya andreesenii]|uniref:YolD-like family protein n=1 Tax=Anoxybacillus andreesenii TaxID=1325932 RepID=A0ABT9V1R8_9BACL|nr:YolD-like family protein [Robertmurraya andreesenii]MDQ0154895.1 hypothetical protein [Robertmurraya andreesenii]